MTGISGQPIGPSPCIPIIYCAPSSPPSLSPEPSHHLPRKLRKGQPGLPIDHGIKVRLREHGQRIPRHCSPNPIAVATGAGTYEMWHGPEPTPRDPLQGLAGLEGQAISRDGDFGDGAVARVDVEACFLGGGSGKEGEGWWWGVGRDGRGRGG